jgi:hypothetical protein
MDLRFRSTTEVARWLFGAFSTGNGSPQFPETRTHVPNVFTTNRGHVWAAVQCTFTRGGVAPTVRTDAQFEAVRSQIKLSKRFS